LRSLGAGVRVQRAPGGGRGRAGRVRGGGRAFAARIGPGSGADRGARASRIAVDGSTLTAATAARRVVVLAGGSDFTAVTSIDTAGTRNVTIGTGLRSVLLSTPRVRRKHHTQRHGGSKPQGFHAAFHPRTQVVGSTTLRSNFGKAGLVLMIGRLAATAPP